MGKSKKKESGYSDSLTMKENFERLESRMIDHFDRSAVAARDSVPPQLSQIVFELKKAQEHILEQLLGHIADEVEKDKERTSLLKEILEQAKRTNGRVTTLESWKDATENYTKGLAQGGRGVWIAFVTTIGIAWVVFGEFIKKKLGL